MTLENLPNYFCAQIDTDVLEGKRQDLTGPEGEVFVGF